MRLQQPATADCLGLFGGNGGGDFFEVLSPFWDPRFLRVFGENSADSLWSMKKYCEKIGGRMVCISVSREDLKRIANGKKGKVKIKTVKSEEKNAKLLLQIFDRIIKYRYIGRRNK